MNYTNKKKLRSKEMDIFFFCGAVPQRQEYTLLLHFRVTVLVCLSSLHKNNNDQILATILGNDCCINFQSWVKIPPPWKQLLDTLPLPILLRKGYIRLTGMQRALASGLLPPAFPPEDSEGTPSSHLILCHPLLLLPSIVPSIRLFSRESFLLIRIPEESLYQTGLIRQRQRCLESQKSQGQEFPLVILNPCITSKGAAAVAQEWTYTYNQQIRYQQLCLSIHTLFPGSQVVLLPCKEGDGKQRWNKVGSHIEHMATRYCLDTEMMGDTNENMREVVINPCESTAMSQRWEMVMS
ncbi:Polypeptide N-acetylgalactosaminyltransferase 14 [Varanus komodoensis]|nr:Polypeptide N-acetylgalactosaminyltransferase 14 [Varanus komodoensis]